MWRSIYIYKICILNWLFFFLSVASLSIYHFTYPLTSIIHHTPVHVPVTNAPDYWLQLKKHTEHLERLRNKRWLHLCTVQCLLHKPQYRRLNHPPGWALVKSVCLVCWQHAVSPRPHSIGLSRQQCKKECRCDDHFISALLKSPSAPSQQAAELNQVALTERSQATFFVLCWARCMFTNCSFALFLWCTQNYRNSVL